MVKTVVACALLSAAPLPSVVAWPNATRNTYDDVRSEPQPPVTDPEEIRLADAADRVRAKLQSKGWQLGSARMDAPRKKIFFRVKANTKDIATLEESASEAASAVADEFKIGFDPVDVSPAALEKTHEQIQALVAAGKLPAGIRSSAVREDHGDVWIGVSAESKAGWTKAIGRLGFTVPITVAESAPAMPQGRSTDSPPWAGAVSTTMVPPGAATVVPATAGFPFRLASGTNGVLAAEHTVNPWRWNPALPQVSYTTMMSNALQVGTLNRTAQAGVDAAFFAGSSYAASAWISDTILRDVAGSATSDLVSETVGVSGRYSANVETGNVSRLGVVQYPSSGSAISCTALSTLVTQTGDSGGIIYKTYSNGTLLAKGIIFGRVIHPVTGSWVTCYVPIANIATKLGGSVLRS